MKRYKFSPFTLDLIKVDDDALFRIYLPFKTQLGLHLLLGVGQTNLNLSLYFHLIPFLRGAK